jgi:hypothetical protein
MSKRKQQAYDALMYSYKRIDILEITISIAGLYLLTGENIDLKTPCLQYSFILFIATLTTNLISQFTGAFANEQDYLMLSSDNDKRKKRYDTLSKILSTATVCLTIISAVLMILALVLLFLGLRGSW